MGSLRDRLRKAKTYLKKQRPIYELGEKVGVWRSQTAPARMDLWDGPIHILPELLTAPRGKRESAVEWHWREREGGDGSRGPPVRTAYAPDCLRAGKVAPKGEDNPSPMRRRPRSDSRQRYRASNRKPKSDVRAHAVELDGGLCESKEVPQKEYIPFRKTQKVEPPARPKGRPTGNAPRQSYVPFRKAPEVDQPPEELGGSTVSVPRKSYVPFRKVEQFPWTEVGRNDASSQQHYIPPRVQSVELHGTEIKNVSSRHTVEINQATHDQYIAQLRSRCDRQVQNYDRYFVQRSKPEPQPQHETQPRKREGSPLRFEIQR